MSKKSNGDYSVFKRYLEEAGFEVLILKIPVNEIEDKLAYLAKEKGQITKSYFEDFVIATSVANINQLLYHINQQMDNPPDLLKVREELMACIIGINEALDPNNLILNKNFVIKIKAGELEVGEKLLIDNKYWSVSYYEDINKLQETFEEEHKKASEEDKNNKISAEDANKKIEDLDAAIVQKWWKRINKYIDVKKFNEKDGDIILRQRYFHNRTSFNAYIVSKCIIDFEELFSYLDSLGVPARVAPPILMNELYQLCRACNPFLTYDRAQELSDQSERQPEADGGHGMRGIRTADAGSMSQYMKKKSQKKFKDVPKKELLTLGDNMKVFLIGQDKAVNDLTEAIQRASVGLKDPYRPIGSFLFAGQTGIGKTFATKVLADELIKGRDNMITIDCSEYSSDHEYAKLIGAPAGYIGHDSGGILTNAILGNPFTVVVFDEVEKASSKVHELLLQILEEGRLTDGKGNTVSFKDAVIVLTSNVGVREVGDIGKTIGFGDVAKITDDKKDSAISRALKDKFKPEFLNRLDNIIYFKSLVKKDYMRIIDIELYKLNDNLKNNDTDYKDVELKFDDKIKEFIYKEGIDEQYGARPLKRTIEKVIATPLAQKLLSEDITNVNIYVGLNKKKVTFKVEEKIDDVPFYMSNQYKETEEGLKKD